ncbi:mucoidy inhibitor MuiA family protein [Corallococcus sp. AB011P]|uniref:mucoidy inhibitor MuiA family protein n=1 Tax=unclassified Corallococcus TaxID=2685029 RepID=UPI000EA37AC4|nr:MULTISPECIES: mucoidy inhibitor MuiA family protein [unclassified Corallococcus]RKG50553.1 mucoidy inhibitor MuiA family protein [Corallococcus sp. AB011P]RKH90972.1 mucoidy inhibitor MuiA family protein [Corallococcus sp. AB045]
MRTSILLPLIKVTVLEDRALVERSGTVTLPPGPCRLVVDGLPAVAVDRSLQAKLTGGMVTQASLRRSMRAVLPEALREHHSELARRAFEREQVLARAQAEVRRLEARHGLLETARRDILRAISERTGAGEADPAKWKEQLATVRQEQTAADDQLRQSRRELGRLERQHIQESRDVLSRTEAPEPRLDVRAELDVSHAAGGEATLTLSYLVPCAAWRPAYRAVLGLAEAASSVKLECEAVVWQNTGEAWKDVTLAFSTARPTLGATPPRLTEDWLSLREKTSREKQVVDVSMREESLQETGEAGTTKAADALPGMDDGGEAVTLSAPHKTTVPSDGEAHRVALFAFTSPATSELVACPEQSPLVHRVAKFDNTGPAVLLAGPVDLVRANGYVGRAQLKFAGRGERVKLGFGSEDSLRVSRQVDVGEEVARITGRRTRTQKVKLFVSNMGAKPAALAVEERMPVSEVEAVEVALLKDATKPAPSKVSDEGIVRFELSVPPRSRQTVAFGFTVARAAKVAGL